MNTILIESQYVGSCSYWSLLLKADAIVLDTHEHFVKRSYRNRAHILGANGLLRLSIPLVSGKHQHSAMKDVRISYNENWQNLHWHSFTSCYRRSPFFEFYEDHFRKFYEQKYDLLTDYNFQFMQVIASVLKSEIAVSFADKYYLKDEFTGTDYRSCSMPGKDVTADFPSYPQVFSDRFPFEKDLCILDLLFNTGTRAKDYIEQIKLR